MIKKASLFIAGLALAASPAFSTIIGPDSGLQAADAFAAGYLSAAGTTVAATVPLTTLSSATWSGSYTETVYHDASNVFCAGCLTFVYQFTSLTGDPLERFTGSSFVNNGTTFLTDAGYISGTGMAPNHVDRNVPGTVIGFDYTDTNLMNGQHTADLVVATNAHFIVPGFFSGQDQTTAFGAALAPTSVPEPISLSLLGGGLSLIGIARWRRKAAK